ncbi:hypothetical protein LTR74_013512 [Friedmanniomyces endolithicus]|nr:hypothetical protein LTR74_013512 [Friedmanniomyces endolithicus]
MRSFTSLLAAIVLAFRLIAQVTTQSSTMSNSSMSTMSTSTKSSSASSSSTESGSAATGTQGFPPMTGGNSGSGDAGGGTSGGTGNTSSVTPSSTKSGGDGCCGWYVTGTLNCSGAMRETLTLLPADYTFVGSAAVGTIVVGLTVTL